VHFNLLSKIGAVLAVIGVIGYVVIFPSVIAKDGQDFVSQARTDANGDENFRDYDSGDKVIIVDKVIRMQYSFDEEGATSIWVESIGNGNVIRFVCDSNYMNDFGIGDNIVLELEIVDEGGGEGFLCEASGRLSTTTEYAFVGLILLGIGMLVFGFVRARKQPSVAQDDWGVPAPPAMAPAPVAPPPAMVPPGLPPQPQNPPSMAAIPGAPPVAPPSAAPSNMTITVPPGVVPGQVLTVTMPNGQVVNVQVPPGCASGSQFTISVTQ